MDNKTIQNTKSRIDKYILPFFKGYKIKDIKHLHLSNFFKQFKDKPATAEKIKVILNHIFKFALSSGYIEENNKMNIHGIRHTFSTLVREHKDQHGIQEDLAIEFSLEHKDKNTIRDTYNKSTLLKERKILIQWWNNYLDNL